MAATSTNFRRPDTGSTQNKVDDGRRTVPTLRAAMRKWLAETGGSNGDDSCSGGRDSTSSMPLPAEPAEPCHLPAVHQFCPSLLQVAAGRDGDATAQTA
eukprot:CAMPEP_0119056690 /NCGR_PEP_ID=MMETSP1178-20130426/1296_1 /TAXON_ID=33656 /ORGANISM="unid sp, Strain CCMP2000" /LENGTH=98 /DNA_ID=CAMNT_0007037441 /DNA_START=166 /DNA_END=458 /DNA_ORIENTATION=+